MAGVPSGLSAPSTLPVARPGSANVEPQLVANQAPPEVRAERPPGVEIGWTRDPLGGKVSVDVAALECAGRGAVPGVAVEVVAPGLDDSGHHDAAQRHLGIRADALHAGFFDRCVIEVIPGHAGLARCREDAFEGLPRLARLSECAERDAVGIRGAPADIDRVPHARRLRKQRKETNAPRRRGFEHLGRQSRTGSRRRDVHDRGGARHQDRLLQCTDLHHDVDLGDESARESEAFAANRRETTQVVADFIRADWQRCEPVLSACVRHARDFRHLQRWTLRHDGDTREHRAALVRDLTDNSRGILTRGSASGRSQNDGQH